MKRVKVVFHRKIKKKKNHLQGKDGTQTVRDNGKDQQRKKVCVDCWRDLIANI